MANNTITEVMFLDFAMVPNTIVSNIHLYMAVVVMSFSCFAVIILTYHLSMLELRGSRMYTKLARYIIKVGFVNASAYESQF